MRRERSSIPAKIIFNDHLLSFCTNEFPKLESWQERFTDGKIKGWPNETEKFKIWTQLEKETVLKYLSEQPAIFRNIPGITFLRGIKSIYDKNPGAAVKRLNAITLLKS